MFCRNDPTAAQHPLSITSPGHFACTSRCVTDQLRSNTLDAVKAPARPTRSTLSMVIIQQSKQCLGSHFHYSQRRFAARPRKYQTVAGIPEPYKRQHEAEQSITFLTPEGLVQLPAWRPPRKVSKLRQRAPLPTWQEQGLCIGNSFWVTATNGLDICRRLNLLGYCRCTELLSDVVEETVLSSGGEVVAREYKMNSGFHESLHLTVAIPLLWGIPDRHEALSAAIASGGGFVDKVYKQWQLYG